MIYKDVMSMLQGLVDDLKDGETVVVDDDPRQLLLGFRIVRDGAEPHRVGITRVRMRKGVTDDIEDLITSIDGRQRMAIAMSHRHQFKDHDCPECVVRDVMES